MSWKPLSLMAILVSASALPGPVEGRPTRAPSSAVDEIGEELVSPPDTGAVAHTVDPARSEIFVVTHRSGLLSFLGHEHAIIPADWSGELCVTAPVESGSGGVLRIRTPSLIIDSDSARALAGLGSGPGEEDVREIQRKLLAPENLAAEEHPEILLESIVEGVGEDPGTLRLRTRVGLRGATGEVRHVVRIEEKGEGGLRLAGSLTLRQTRFGIEPESVAGVVNVSDEVDLHFSLVSVPTGENCSPRGVTRAGAVPREPGQ